MKHKISLLLTIGALAFGATAAGLVEAKSAQLAKAEDAKSTGVYLTGSFTSWNDTDLMYIKTGTTYQYYLTRSMASGDTFKVHDKDHDAWVNSLDASISATLFSVQTSGDYNVICNTAGLYKVSYTYSNSSTRWISSIEAIASYTVSEYAVVDGTAEATVARTENADPSATFTPASLHRTNFVFGGWYTDPACTAAYTATTLTGDTTLYAKYTTAASTKKVYFGASGWTDVYVYTFGTSETCGAFPGTKMAATAAVTNVNFQSKGLYSYDVPFGTGGDTNIIFSNYSGTTNIAQTADLVLTDSVYYASDSAKDYAGSADLYNAANWVKTIARAVASATNASVCSISKEDATADVALYKGYSTDAQTAINGATLYTWKDINRVDTEKLDVSFAAIYAQLDKISTALTSPAAGVVLDNNTTPVLVMVISLSVAALAAGGLWMSRRKEH